MNGKKLLWNNSMPDHAPKPPKPKLSKTDFRRDSQSLRRERSLRDERTGDVPDELDEILFDPAPPAPDPGNESGHH
jgi:hypothetical protein